jgi:DNA replication protein DnaC
MTHSFNKKQQLSVDKINEFISQNVEKKFYLFGYAGTGKTILISNVTMQLIADNKMDHIFICAPTHKALNVIESYFRSNFDPIKQKELMTKISFMTIHKLLEFKPIIANEDGSKIFKSTKESKFLKQMDNKLIIMDECSMISEDMVTQLDKLLSS